MNQQQPQQQQQQQQQQEQQPQQQQEQQQLPDHEPAAQDQDEACWEQDEARRLQEYAQAAEVNGTNDDDDAANLEDLRYDDETNEQPPLQQDAHMQEVDVEAAASLNGASEVQAGGCGSESGVQIAGQADEPAESNEDERSRKRAAYTCEMCGEGAAKYCCPGCSCRTCSLTCSKRHKEERQCDGKRDKLAFVTLEKFDDRQLLSDYRLLEEVGRVGDVAHRHRPPAAKPQLPPALANLVYQADRRRVQLMVMPPGMHRRRSNTTRYDGRTRRLSWRIEWLFQKVGQRVVDEQVAEDMLLNEVLARHITWQPGAAARQFPLAEYADAGIGSLKVFMRKERTPANATTYYTIDISRPLGSQLAGKLVVEFPVLVVALPGEESQFPSAFVNRRQQHTNQPPTAATQPLHATLPPSSQQPLHATLPPSSQQPLHATLPPSSQQPLHATLPPSSQQPLQKQAQQDTAQAQQQQQQQRGQEHHIKQELKQQQQQQQQQGSSQVLHTQQAATRPPQQQPAPPQPQQQSGPPVARADSTGGTGGAPGTGGAGGTGGTGGTGGARGTGGTGAPGGTGSVSGTGCTGVMVGKVMQPLKASHLQHAAQPAQQKPGNVGHPLKATTSAQAGAHKSGGVMLPLKLGDVAVPGPVSQSAPHKPGSVMMPQRAGGAPAGMRPAMHAGHAPGGVPHARPAAPGHAIPPVTVPQGPLIRPPAGAPAGPTAHYPQVLAMPPAPQAAAAGPPPPHYHPPQHPPQHPTQQPPQHPTHPPPGPGQAPYPHIRPAHQAAPQMRIGQPPQQQLPASHQAQPAHNSMPGHYMPPPAQPHMHRPPPSNTPNPYPGAPPPQPPYSQQLHSPHHQIPSPHALPPQHPAGAAAPPLMHIAPPQQQHPHLHHQAAWAHDATGPGPR